MPGPTYVTTPFAFTVATAGLLLLHVSVWFVALLGLIVFGIVATVLDAEIVTLLNDIDATLTSLVLIDLL